MIITWFATHPTLALWIIGPFALVAGWFVNWTIIQGAYHRRSIGAWNPPPKGMPCHSWLDWLPIVGWWRLRRESPAHGKNFWLRPFLIELVFPMAMLWLFIAQSTGQLLLNAKLAAPIQDALISQYVGYFILIVLMTAATFIDFDEQLIPDTITIPGTLIGLIGAALMPAWLPFVFVAGGLSEMHSNSNSVWPTWLDGGWGLAIALSIASGWCFGLLDRVWITRRGWSKAPKYFLAVIFRTRWWMIVGAIWLATIIGICLFWIQTSPRWQFLLSSLFGLAFSGGMTWAVRIAARLALGVEALGFGDVTLMAMIGTYIGWQPSLIVFFVAPLVAVVFFLGRYLVIGDGAGPYGPYLCIATLLVILYWQSLADSWALAILTLPPQFTLLIISVAIMLMGVALWLWHRFVGTVSGLGRRY